MEEKDLVELGLLAKGDRIKLKSFCKKGISSDREEKIARIKQILGQGKGKKRGDPTFSAAVGSTSSRKSARTSSLKYEVGWKHWKPGRGYVQMKKIPVVVLVQFIYLATLPLKSAKPSQKVCFSRKARVQLVNWRK